MLRNDQLKLSTEICKELAYSTEFFNPLTIMSKIKDFVKNIFVLAKPFKYTSLTGNYDININKLKSYMKTSVPLPDIMVSVPRGFSTTFTTSLTELKTALNTVDLLEVLGETISCFSSINIGLKNGNLDSLNNISTDYPELTSGKYTIQMDSLNTQMFDYFKNNYKENIHADMLPINTVFINKQGFILSINNLQELTQIYNVVVNRITPRLDACYKVLNELIQNLSKFKTLDKRSVSVLYTLISNLANTFQSYGKLLAEIQTMEFHVILNTKTILNLL